MFKKLITREDPHHLHKVCGIFVLINYIYQIYLFAMFDEMYLNIFILTPHILLHSTSFIFNVLSKRPKHKKMNMFIWNELRIHSFIFASRAILIILDESYAKFIVILAMIAADVTTYIYGTQNVSTVRGYSANVHKRSFSQNTIAAFFCSSQLGATLICSGCFQHTFSKELVFLTLPPIQTSAFGMTLLRKNIISKKTWSIIYSIELILVYLAWFKIYNNINLLWYSILLYFTRKYIFNNYMLWLTIYISDLIMTNPEYINIISH